MIAFKAAAIRLLRHPSAGLAGIIVTFVVALVTLIPAADEYSALKERSDEVSYLLKQGRRDQEQLPQLKSLQRKLRQQLATYQQQAVGEDQAYALRQTLVDFSREANCQVRRVDLGPSRVRQWHEGDHPTHVTNPKGRKKSGFLLEVREFRMTVNGSIPQIEKFLEKFATLQVQMDIQQLNLRSVDPRGDQMQLELSLQLFGVHSDNGDRVSKT